jgi:hypothetical protein
MLYGAIFGVEAFGGVNRGVGVRRISVSDSVSVTDNFTPQVVSYVSVFDSVATSENVTLVVLALIVVFETVSVSESITLVLEIWGYEPSPFAPQGSFFDTSLYGGVYIDEFGGYVWDEGALTGAGTL